MEVVEDGVQVGASLAVDSLDRPHVAYSDMDGGVKHGLKTDTAWGIELVDASCSSPCEVDLAIDSIDNPQLAYADLTKEWLRYARWTGSDWSVETVESEGVRGGVSISVDSLGNPHIAYAHGFGANSSVRYAFRMETGWIHHIVDATPQSGLTDIAVDSFDEPHIAYTVFPANEVKYAHRGRDWTVSTVSPPGTEAVIPSIAVDAQNSPHIAFSGKGQYYANLEDGMWITEEVSSEIISWSSLALDSLGGPHLALVPGPEGNLTYAFRKGAEWKFETIAAETNGNFLRLVFDSSDVPHIAFIDGMALKYAARRAPQEVLSFQWVWWAAPISLAVVIPPIYFLFRSRRRSPK
jgi:hypothetical protein